MRQQVAGGKLGRLWALLAMLALAFLSSACDGARLPREIASDPQRDARQQTALVTEARLELTVRDSTRAAGEVARLAVAHGGTVLDEEHWRSRDGRSASLTLLVPAAHFDAFRRALQTVGSIVTERLVQSRDYGSLNTQVSVTLHEAVGGGGGDWDPALTFGKAFAVFLRLFQALVDGLIWILVVAGPFALMVIGLLAVLRRMRQTRSER